MEALKQSILIEYYNNLQKQAKKNKVSINLPKLENKMDNIVVSDVAMTSTQSEITQSELDETIYSDDYVYKKPWNKLNSIHKIIKMKEFVNNIKMDDIEMKKHLKNQLIQMVKDRKLTKKNDVEYDSINGIIISIPSLQYKNNNYNIVV
jgi:hypothetical protein